MNESWARLFFRSRMRTELTREMAAHLEAKTAALLEEGLSPEEAARRARIEFGNTPLLAERSAEIWRWPRLESTWDDLKLALYKLRKSPGYAVVAILTMVIGIGASTTIFTILDAVMLRSLPVQRPSELVSFGIKSPMQPRVGIGIPARLADLLRDHSHSYSDVSGWDGSMVAVRDSEGSLRSVDASMVTGNALPMLGLRPHLGRLIEPTDDIPGGPVGGWPVVLNYDFWLTNFHGDLEVIGKPITVSAQPAVIVGVLPASFSGIFIGSPNKLYLPAHFASKLAATADQDPYLHPESRFEIALGRLARGVSLTQANAELASGYASAWRDMIPAPMRDSPFMRGATLVVSPANRGFSELAVQYGSSLLMLQGVVLLVLLLCCVNLGGLQLARVQRHQQEFAIRNALGAGRTRILRQCLTESFLIAAAGSILAAALAWLATPTLGAFLTPAGSGENSVVRPDASILLLTTLLSVVTTLMFGLLPALQAGGTSPAIVLKGQGTNQRSSNLRRNLLVSGQFALTLVLVFGAGLFTQTLSRLRNNHAGFEPAHILEVCAQFQALHKTPVEIASIYHLMTAKLRTYPGVESAAYTWVTPLTGFAPKLNVHSLAHAEHEHSIAFNEVGDGYFSTIGTRLLAGREFTTDDADRTICVLNQSAAHLFFADAIAIGETLKSENPEAKWTAVCRVVGIVEDARYSNLRDPAPATVYFPAGAPALAQGGYANNFVFFIRSAHDADSMAAYRAALTEYGEGTAYSVFLPLQEQVDQSLGSERLISILSSSFAGVALLLSGIGIFGLLALQVQQRKREIGVRMALGADRASVLRMITKEAMKMIAIGTLVGVIIALTSGVLVRRFLYGVSAANPWIAAASVAILFAVGLAASVIPARRAALLDPMLSLRSE